MASETQLLRLALTAYEVAADPDLLPGFLRRFTETVSADSAVLQIHDLGRRASFIIGSFGVSSPFTQSYNEHYSKVNVWREHGQSLYIAGRVNLGEEQCSRPLLERSEFYNDYLLRIGAVSSLGLVIAREGHRAPTLSVLRGSGKPAFGEHEREIGQFLAPHLSRAWTMQQHLQLLSAGESVLDTLSLGVVFLAPDGRAIHWNRAADKMIRDNDGLSLLHGLISIADKRADAQFRKTLNHSLAPHQLLGPAAVAVPRPSLRRAYQIVTAPLRGRFPQFKGMIAPAAVVLITDPERHQPASVDLLIHLYDLTPKEAAMAAKLSLGKSVEEAAGEMNITYETARTHLRRIFSKTGTSRQTELMLLITRLPPALENL
ncbi:MAG: helix-turn-helix transcriptional regulator [Bryobacteraceae bacterium]